ncbi:YvrJ family protein [Oceanobacillus luteolus]|uniref:YvrJ family protein n=1 Tax=Oceanobacillus luteolus TaxID=1274358 RepID=A0ABW4HRS4_9BACI|nr:YvrJ family protein [Oceanobacillus luteolus]MCM3740617.1 YvrJ family protein [Oceanobacillus luteolus]
MSPVETPVWVAIIGNFGFPIAITMYLFIRFEKKLGDLERVITNLSETIKQLTNKQ